MNRNKFQCVCGFHAELKDTHVCIKCENRRCKFCYKDYSGICEDCRIKEYMQASQTYLKGTEDGKEIADDCGSGSTAVR